MSTADPLRPAGGVDRAIGYGLKYPTGFKNTHLQRV